MIALILMMPLIGFLVSAIFGRFLGGKGVVLITCFNVGCAFLLSSYLLYDIIENDYVVLLVFAKWIQVGSLEVDWSIFVDSLSAIMLVVVTFISALVHLYSSEYMKEDPHLQRFMSYLSLFTFFMLILVTANNFLQMFVGWEGVGLSSYLLINFWFTRIQANKSAIKAMLLNRIGDFFLLFALLAIYYVFDSLDYAIVFTMAPLMVDSTICLGGFYVPAIDVICVCLFLGAMGKSAQLGLHTWLPDAMEGPTPVSALIHAATMVTAGVFLIIRCSYLFELSSIALDMMAVVGSLTAFFGATIGLFQNDLKKIIAYSTCSQLGYMVFACGLSSYNVAMFHLSNHAIFKALLFLGAGSIIHSVADEQDIRKLGGLFNLLPASYSYTLIGSLALLGIPFFTGFYSKDTLLEVAYASQTTVSLACYFLGTLSAFCTAFYSTRLIYLVFLSNSNSNKSVALNAYEGSWRLTLPLLLLSLLSITLGFFTQDLFIGFGTSFWNASIFILPENYNMTDIEFISIFYKLLPLLFTLLGSVLAFFLYSSNISLFLKLKKNKLYSFFYTFLFKKWYWDKLYNSVFVSNILEFSYFYTYHEIDRGLLEKVGPESVSNKATKLSSFFSLLQSGNVHFYLFFTLFSTLCSILLFSLVCYSDLPAEVLLFLLILFGSELKSK